MTKKRILKTVDAAETEQAAEQEDCWNHIGFRGDRSCPELERLGHCHNCRVFITASRRLLERDLPPGYLEEWATAVAQPKEVGYASTESLLVFRLGSEFLALPTWTCEEVSLPGQIHTVPHLSNPVFLGLVNLRGEIQPCFSLAAALGIKSDASGAAAWIALHERGDVWVFPVDEVLTVHRVGEEALSAAPVTLGAAHQSFTTAMVDWNGRRVDLLDPRLIVQELARRLA
ncbi:MAG: purine-binding chemotaxis protein CheW [Gemmatimonadetes bacterium]|nr:chemotaxis protein CheW [Gemmatimonadota bacterium]NNM07478.1 purine-binding chemotaxis protein CheW [Gemmatimonadota bacterium]